MPLNIIPIDKPYKGNNRNTKIQCIVTVYDKNKPFHRFNLLETSHCFKKIKNRHFCKKYGF